MSATSATATGLAKRYADAVYDLARERGELDRVATDLLTVEQALAESPDLRRLVASPVLSREEQGRAVTMLAERQGLSETVQGFLGVLASHRRLFALSMMLRAFHARLSAERGEIEADVTSAVPLTQDETAAVEASVERFAGRKVTLRHEVDPTLLGGLVVRIGSRMIDASLKSKLQKLELSMRGLG